MRYRSRKKKYRSGPSKEIRIDAATKASVLQLQQERKELFYSLVALAMKLGLLSIGVLSLFKLCLASHQRFIRHAELSSVLNVESMQLNSLQKRFDHLFTIGGDRRLMDEQEQWIAPNRVRVIWQ